MLPSPETLPRLAIDLAQTEDRHRRDFVHDLLGITWDITDLDVPPESLCWRSDVWMLDRIMIGTREVSPLAKQRPARRVRADGMDHYQIFLPTSGEIIADCGDHELIIRPGEVAIFELGRSWRIRCSQTQHTTFVVPRASLPGPHGTLPIANGSLARGAAGAMLASHLRQLLHSLPALNPAQAGHLAQATSHMIAACLDPTPENEERAAPALQAAHLTRLTRLVDSRLQDPDLTPDVICAALGLSRSNLYRLMAPHGGVRAFITDRRIARACARMRDPDASPRLSTLAEICGFADLAAFSHAFKRKTGQSPSAYRADLAPPPPPSLTPGLPPQTQIRRWLAAMTTPALS